MKNYVENEDIIKVNDNGNTYYLVETTVDLGELRNQNGEEAVLNVGILRKRRKR